MCLEGLVIIYLYKKKDQRIYIKFSGKNGIKCSQVLEVLSIAFGGSAMSVSKKAVKIMSGLNDPAHQQREKSERIDYERSCEAIQKKKKNLNLWQNNSWLLYFDNMPAHT